MRICNFRIFKYPLTLQKISSSFKFDKTQQNGLKITVENLKLKYRIDPQITNISCYNKQFLSLNTLKK